MGFVQRPNVAQDEFMKSADTNHVKRQSRCWTIRYLRENDSVSFRKRHTRILNLSGSMKIKLNGLKLKKL